jgi:uncharacterized protein YndB with AHSA1/START domain
MPAATEALPELTFVRTFEAPRALVFKVWTDPYHVAQWWGPHGLTIPVSKVDARVGGRFEVHMQAPDGRVFPSVGTFHELVPYERIVVDSNLVDGAGKKLIEVLNTISLEEAGAGTRMTLHIKVLAAVPEVAASLATMEQGWSESLERLGAEISRVAGVQSDASLTEHLQE